jgi:nitrate/TMAO reductase-like tetraheme cytochrome c subunit
MREGKRRPWLSALALTVVLAAGSWGVAAAMESGDCLGCHADAGSVGERAAIAEPAFAATPHAEMGCLACHPQVADSHPDDGLTVGKAACSECHGEVAAEYGKTLHSAGAGCSDCHDPHAVRGQHEVSGYDVNRQCAACHAGQEMTEKHRQWLPQTEVHLASLPCITCHTGSEKLALELYVIHDGKETAEGDFELAGYSELAALSGGGEVASLIDRNGNGQISIDELRSFNRNPAYRGFRLHGMMVPAQMTHSYDILYNRWDCTFCHGTGPESLQTSFLSFPGADGSYRRLPVESGAVLSVLYATPDFYMVGATRNTALNLAGAMILAGGLVMPVGHGFLRFLTRKNRQ